MKVDRSLIYFPFSSGARTSFETDKLFSRQDDLFWCSIKVLMPIQVRMLFILSWFIIFSVAKGPSQVSSMAKVMISLLDSLC